MKYFQGYERDEESGSCVDPRARGEMTSPAPAQTEDIWGSQDQGYPGSSDRYRPPASYNNERYQETMKGYPRPSPDPITRDQETMKGYPRPGYRPDRYPMDVVYDIEEEEEGRYHNPTAYSEERYSDPGYDVCPLVTVRQSSPHLHCRA